MEKLLSRANEIAVLRSRASGTIAGAAVWARATAHESVRAASEATGEK
jgi:hypothetical protein